MKLTELEKLKYWMDAEFSIIHLLIAIVFLMLTEGLFVTLLISGYIVITTLYTISRLRVLSQADRDYLKLPKK